MSQKNNEVTENQILMEQFIQSWAKFTIDHPQVTLGEWLKTFGIITGLAMKMGNLQSDQVGVALGQMSNVVGDVFKRADEHIQMATLQ
jgi:hypothetical protein